MDEGQLHFKLSIEEANLIFKALGQMPFAEVYELIGKLNDQANQQLQNPDQANNHHNYPNHSENNY